MDDTPKGYKRKITDAELREAVASGLKPHEIAVKYDVSKAAISKRMKGLDTATTAVVTAPEESRRYVNRSIDAMGELTDSLYHVKLLMAACDEWLRDADDPEKYDIGPRSDEINVSYYEIDLEGKRKKVKKPLHELLRIVEQVFEVSSVESKHADPRELILKTAQEVRSTISTAADLAQTILNIQAMNSFRHALLTEIEKVDPDVARRIAEAVRRSHVLHYTAGGLGGLPSGVVS